MDCIYGGICDCCGACRTYKTKEQYEAEYEKADSIIDAMREGDYD